MQKFAKSGIIFLISKILTKGYKFGIPWMTFVDTSRF